MVGLAMYGRKVMATIGQNITRITPSKAACAQWAATCVVLIATRAGIPISTTHAAVGGVLGVGLADGVKSIDWMVMAEVFGSWVVTLPLVGIVAAGAFGLFLGPTELKTEFLGKRTPPSADGHGMPAHVSGTTHRSTCGGLHPTVGLTLVEKAAGHGP